jgi:hypothetical protein
MIEEALVISNGHRIELDGTGLGDTPPILHLHEEIIDARGKPIYILGGVHLSHCDLITDNVVIAGERVIVTYCRILTTCKGCSQIGKEP